MKKKKREVRTNEAREAELSGYFRNAPPFLFDQDKKIAEIVIVEDKYKRHVLKHVSR